MRPTLRSFFYHHGVAHEFHTLHRDVVRSSVKTWSIKFGRKGVDQFPTDYGVAFFVTQPNVKISLVDLVDLSGTDPCVQGWNADTTDHTFLECHIDGRRLGWHMHDPGSGRTAGHRALLVSSSV